MRFAVGVPHVGRFSGKFVDCIQALQPPRDGYWWIRVEGLPVDEARNEIVQRFLSHDNLEYLLMIDADMGFAPRSMARLAQVIQQPEADMVGALAFTRIRPPVPSLFRDVTRKTWRWSWRWPFVSAREWLRIQVQETLGWLEAHPEGMVEEPAVLEPAPADAVVRAHATGGAFVMFKRQVFEALCPPWFVRDALKKGEDFDFFQKARAAGFKLWVDRSVIVGHEWGAQWLGPVDFVAYQSVYPVEGVET